MGERTELRSLLSLSSLFLLGKQKWLGIVAYRKESRSPATNLSSGVGLCFVGLGICGIIAWIAMQYSQVQDMV